MREREKGKDEGGKLVAVCVCVLPDCVTTANDASLNNHSPHSNRYLEGQNSRPVTSSSRRSSSQKIFSNYDPVASYDDPK